MFLDSTKKLIVPPPKKKLAECVVTRRNGMGSGTGLEQDIARKQKKITWDTVPWCMCMNMHQAPVNIKMYTVGRVLGMDTVGRVLGISTWLPIIKWDVCFAACT